MGCCESCGVSTHRSRQSAALPQQKLFARLGIEEVPELAMSTPSSSQTSRKSSTTDSTLYGSPKDTGEDEKSTEIENFVSDILGKAGWKVHASDDTCEVRCFDVGLSGATDVPVFSLKIDFSSDVDLELVWKVLYDAEVRVQWDRSVSVLEQTQLSPSQWIIHSVTKMPFPFKNRDFSEKRVVRELPQLITTTHYSVTEQSGGLPVCEQYERAEEFFSSARILKADGCTRLMLVSQYDLRLPVPPKQIVAMAAAQLKTWAREIKKKVLELENKKAET